jgi:hypothetical protein
MSGFGVILIILAAPLLIGYGIGEKKNPMWKNLGALMGVVGLAILLLGSCVR